MTSLSDQIDLLNRNTKNIISIANTATQQPIAGPFTSAILHSHLGNLIRDVDPTELGLFSLLNPHRQPQQERLPPSISALERVSFHGATPLKRPSARNDDASRSKDTDPELYAQAALKYMDRYTLVRPMPRAQAQVQAILERIPTIRQNIENLTDNLYTLEQAKSSDGSDLKVQLEEEERRIKELRLRLKELTDKRSALTKAKKSHLNLAGDNALVHKPLATSEPKAAEEEFWNTPATAIRTFSFSDNLLLNENVDLGDITALSFSASPTISRITPIGLTDIIIPTDTDPSASFQTRFSRNKPDIVLESVSVRSSPNMGSSPPPSPSPASSASPGISVIPKQVPLTSTTPGDPEIPELIPISREIQAITDKIWASMNELIKVTALATVNKQLADKPLARDTIEYLRKMETVIPDDSLSATTSNDAVPSTQQALTAALLLGLLSSPSNHSLPLGKVKELLSLRLETCGSASQSAQQNPSRIVYGCVAKRLLKIDRTGGDQIVRFDV